MRVTEKVPVPFVSVASAGSTTPEDESLLAKWTVPAYEVTGWPWPSWAVTVIANACPAVAPTGLVTLRLTAVDAPTLTESVPVMLAFAVSVAEIVCEPALTSVTEKLPVPLVSVASAGRTTPCAASLLVKWTVPA